MKRQWNEVIDIFPSIIAQTTEICEQIIFSCDFSMVLEVIIQILLKRGSLEIRFNRAWWPFEMCHSLISWHRQDVNPARFIWKDFSNQGWIISFNDLKFEALLWVDCDRFLIYSLLFEVLRRFVHYLILIKCFTHLNDSGLFLIIDICLRIINHHILWWFVWRVSTTKSFLIYSSSWQLVVLLSQFH